MQKPVHIITWLAGMMFFITGSVALAAPSWIFQRSIIPEITSRYELGTTTKTWLTVFTDNLCLNGDCRSAWPTGGGGGGSGGAWATTTNNILTYLSLQWSAVVGGTATTSDARFSVFGSSTVSGTGMFGGELRVPNIVATSSATSTFPVTYMGTSTVSNLNGVVYVDGVRFAKTESGLRSAINQACNGTTYGYVNIPTGNYILTADLNIPSNCSISGDATIFVGNNSFKIGNVSNVQISGLNFDGTAQTTNNRGILIVDSHYIHVEKTTLLNMNGFGIFIDANANSSTTDVYITKNKLTGMGNADVIGGGPNSSSGYVRNIHITENVCTQTWSVTALYPNCIDLVSANQLHIENNTSYGRIVFGSEGYAHQDSTMIGNTIFPAVGTTTGGISVLSGVQATTSTRGVTISGNTIYLGDIQINGSSTYPIYSTSIFGNTINAPYLSNGIILTEATGDSVTGNTITNAFQAIKLTNATGTSISGNSIASSTSSVVVGGGASNFIGVNTINGLITSTYDILNIASSTNIFSLNSNSQMVIGGTNYGRLSVGMTTFPYIFNVSGGDSYGSMKLQGGNGSLLLEGGGQGDNNNYIQSANTSLTSNLPLKITGAFNTTGSLLYLDFATSSVTGSFAVGTTSPWAKVVVQNRYGATIPLFDVATTTNLSGSGTSSLFSVLPNGNIGIGSSTPSSIFSIDGVANFKTATSSFSSSGGIDLVNGGCFAIKSTCLISGTNYSASYPLQISGSVFSTALSTTTSQNWSGLNVFQASTTIGDGSQTGGLTISGGATTTATSTMVGAVMAIGGGNVGIGMTNPNARLELNSGSAGTLQLRFSNTTNPATNYWEMGRENVATGDFVFLSKGNERVRFGANGLVGIGTTSPYSKLSVAGPVVAESFFATSTTASTTIKGLFAVLNSATSTFQGGINLEAGCFSIKGTCVGAGSSYTDAQARAAVVGLFPATTSINTWSAGQIFLASSTLQLAQLGSTTINNLDSASSTLGNLVLMGSATSSNLYILNQLKIGTTATLPYASTTAITTTASSTMGGIISSGLGAFTRLSTSGAGTSTLLGGNLDVVGPINSGTASSTFFGLWSTNGLHVSTLTNCDTVDTDASGNFKCGTDATGAGGGVWPFVGSSNYSVNVQSTSTPLWFTGTAGVYASGTSYFNNLNIQYPSGTGVPFTIYANTSNVNTTMIENSGGDATLSVRSDAGYGAAWINLYSTAAEYQGITSYISDVLSWRIGNSGANSGLSIFVGSALNELVRFYNNMTVNINGRLGIASSTPWASFSLVSTTTEGILTPAMVIATSTDLSSVGFFAYWRPTAITPKWWDIHIGGATSSSRYDKDNITTFGQQNSDTLMVNVDPMTVALGASLTEDSVVTSVGPGAVFDEITDGNFSITSFPTSTLNITGGPTGITNGCNDGGPWIQLKANELTGAVADEGAWLRGSMVSLPITTSPTASQGGTLTASGTPTMEVTICTPTVTNAYGTSTTVMPAIYAFGFGDSAFGTTFAGSAVRGPANGSFIIASTTDNWWLVSTNANVGVKTNTGVSTSSTRSNPTTFRLSMTATATYAWKYDNNTGTWGSIGVQTTQQTKRDFTWFIGVQNPGTAGIRSDFLFRNLKVWYSPTYRF